MDDPQPSYAAGQEVGAKRIEHLMEARRVGIRFLSMIEDDLVAAGALRPEDRACLTREMRRGMAFGRIDIPPDTR